MNGGAFSAAKLVQIINSKMKQAIAKSAPGAIRMAIESETSPARKQMAAILSKKVSSYYDNLFKSNKDAKAATGMDKGDSPMTGQSKLLLESFFNRIIQNNLQVDTLNTNVGLEQLADMTDALNPSPPPPNFKGIKSQLKSLFNQQQTYSYKITIPVDTNDSALGGILVSGKGVPWYQNIKQKYDVLTTNIQETFKKGKSGRTAEARRLKSSFNKIFPGQKDIKNETYKKLKDELIKFSSPEALMKLLSQNERENVDINVIAFMSNFLIKKWGG